MDSDQQINKRKKIQKGTTEISEADEHMMLKLPLFMIAINKAGWLGTGTEYTRHCVLQGMMPELNKGDSVQGSRHIF